MKTYKAVFTGNIFNKQELSELKIIGIHVKSEKMALTENQLIKALERADIYIMGGDDIATQKVINSAKNLKLIVFLGTGYEKYIDLKTAKKRGIKVTCTPQANAPTVAEHTVALILDAVKQTTYLNNSTKKGAWERRQSWNLEGKTLGIIGMGAIGSKVARILKNGFDMKILYTNPSKKKEVEKELAAKKVELDELLKNSDIISINAKYSKQTVGMVSVKQLNLVKPTAVLVNTARAEIIDHLALYQALKNNKLNCAAFDGYYQEPPNKPKKDQFKLLSLKDNKFIITPHTAYNSKDALRAMANMMIESIADFVSGKNLRHEII